MSAVWQGGSACADFTEPCGQSRRIRSVELVRRVWAVDAAPVNPGEDRRTSRRTAPRSRRIGAKSGRNRPRRCARAKTCAYLPPCRQLCCTRTGLPFLAALRVACGWLELYWEQTYPVLDGDGFSSALNCFADPIAVIDRLRRVPLVSSRQHGMLSLRVIEADGTVGGHRHRAAERGPDQGCVR